MKLEIEMTDKMAAKLQERANAQAVEPADIAKWILACELARSEKPCWIDKLSNIVTRVSDAVIAVSKMQAPKEEGE